MLARRISLIFRRTFTQHIIESPFGIELSYPNITVDQYIWQNISKWENHTAIECGITGKRMTYKELRSRSKSFANSLSTLGLSGRTAFLLLPNCVEYPVAILGAMEAGVTVSPANPDYTPGELKYQLEDSGATAVITDSSYLDRFLPANLNMPIICSGDTQGAEGVHSFKQMMDSTSESFNLPRPEDRLKLLAGMPYSSGTTGLPKGVMLSHKNIVSNLVQVTKNVNPIHETTAQVQESIPGVLPFYHIYGFVVILLHSLSHGSKIVTLPKFEPSSFIQVLCKNKDIVLYAVPPMISFLAGRAEVKPDHLQNIILTLSGAAPCGERELSKLKEKKDHPIIQGFGMTEGTVLTLPERNCKDGATVGPPVPGTMAKVVDLTSGMPLPPYHDGELCFKGPQIMEGYRNRPEETSDTLDTEGWLHTGDIGFVNNKGDFYIIDRLKELIKVKAFQVAPAELEVLLRQHPSIEDAGVTSVPSNKSGELPVAFIVPKPGEVVEEGKICKWVADQVAPYKRVARVIKLEHIPKSPSGKILRRKLKDMAREEITTIDEFSK